MSLSIAIATLIRRPRQQPYFSLSLLSFALVTWHVASIAGGFGGVTVERLQLAAAMLVPPLTSLFFRALLRDRSTRARGLTRTLAIASTTLLVIDASPLAELLAIRATMVAYVIVGIGLVLHSLARAVGKLPSESERKRLRYLLYAGLVTLMLGAAKVLPGVDLAALGHVAATIYLYFLYQSVLALRLLDMVELLGKAAVLAFLTLLLASIYALLVVWVGAESQGVWLFHTLVASFVILILYDQIRPWVEEATAKLLFRERVVSEQALRRLVRRLRTVISLDEMRDRVFDELLQTIHATNGSIYLGDEEEELSFRLLGWRGKQPPRRLTLASHPAVLQALRRERLPLLLEHLAHRRLGRTLQFAPDDPGTLRDAERIDEAMATMRLLGAQALVPMLADERVVGIIALGSEPHVEEFSTTELSALISVAEACAIVVENSQAYERRRQRDRLVALGEMAAGMAHEIRNPLGAIKGAAQCLEPAGLSREANELVAVIVEEVDRLNRVLAQFLEYVRPVLAEPSPTDVNAVVQATLQLLRNEQPPGVEVLQDLALHLPPVSLDPEHLKQVLINLLRNSFQALGEHGRVRITSAVAYEPPGAVSQSERRSLHHAHVLLRVSDEGPGIPEEDLSRIFVPFFTTKPQGTGLGLAISQRLIESSHGRIEVQSRPGEGTAFTLRLPVAAAGESHS